MSGEAADRRFVEAWIDSGAMLSVGRGRVLAAAGPPERLGVEPEGVSFYAPDFFLDDPLPFRVYPENRLVDAASLASALAGVGGAAGPVPFGPASREAFDRDLDSLREPFRSGALLKAVPVATREARVAATPALRARVLRNALLRAEAASSYAFGTWDALEGIAGATPELLFEVAPGGRVRTMALAATRVEGAAGSSPPPLLDDPKEAEEHRLVVESIRESLVSFGEVLVGPTREARVPGLTHLRTDVDVLAGREPRFLELVRALHPTPALGTFPKDPSLSWLREADARAPFRRGRFGAPFGAALGGAMSRVDVSELPRASCVVAIRGVRWAGGSVLVSAGCGVLPRSDPDREWREIAAKLSVCEKLFAP